MVHVVECPLKCNLYDISIRLNFFCSQALIFWVLSQTDGILIPRASAFLAKTWVICKYVPNFYKNSNLAIGKIDVTYDPFRHSIIFQTVQLLIIVSVWIKGVFWIRTLNICVPKSQKIPSLKINSTKLFMYLKWFF